MVLWGQDLVVVQMGTDVRAQDVLHQFTGDTRERDRAVVGWRATVALLEDRRNEGFGPISGKSPSGQ